MQNNEIFTEKSKTMKVKINKKKIKIIIKIILKKLIISNYIARKFNETF